MAQYYYYVFCQRSYLNPYSPQFHPIFPSNNNISNNFTSNNVITNDYYNYIYYNNDYYYYYPNNHSNNNNNHHFPYCLHFQNLPYDNTNLFPMQQVNNLNYHGQPPPELGQLVSRPLRAAHVNASPSSQRRPNIRAWNREDGGASSGRRSRWEGCDNGSNRSDYYERKQGFYFNNLGKRRGSERKKEISEIMVMKVKPNGVETTAMIRNIPNQYTRDMLIKFLDEFCRIENKKLDSNDDNVHQPLAFDFLYLPIDFRRGANKGYAFVNFTNPIAVWKLHLAYSNRHWEFFKSPKSFRINYATIQGKENLVEHFGVSKFVCNHDEYLPVWFSPPRDGSNSASVTETTVGKRFSPRN